MKTKICFLVSLTMLFLIIAGIVVADPTAGLYKIAVNTGWNLIALPMQTLQLQPGRIMEITENTVTVNVSLTENEYINDILYITSGTAEGYFYTITANSGNTITVAGTLVAQLIAVSDTCCIYKAYTLTELFGDQNGPLYPGTSSDVADEIYLWDTAAQAFSTQIWLSNEGWRQGAILITDNSVTLNPNQSCFIVHKLATTVTINYVGIVPDIKMNINLQAGDAVGGLSYPAAVTVGDSGLDTVLQHGVSSAVADNIYLWNYSEQKFDLPIWHYSDGNPYQGSDLAGSVSLSAGAGIMIRNRAGEVNWQRAKPYTAP